MSLTSTSGVHAPRRFQIDVMMTPLSDDLNHVCQYHCLLQKARCEPQVWASHVPQEYLRNVRLMWWCLSVTTLMMLDSTIACFRSFAVSLRNEPQRCLSNTSQLSDWFDDSRLSDNLCVCQYHYLLQRVWYGPQMEGSQVPQEYLKNLWNWRWHLLLTSSVMFTYHQCLGEEKSLRKKPVKPLGMWRL